MNSFDINKLSRFVAGEAMDGVANQRYVIDCVDSENEIRNLLRHIKEVAGTGHSFDVVVDPGSDEKTFFIDGDGSDRIDTITAIDRKYNLEGVMLSAIRKIKHIARDSAEDKDAALQAIYDVCCPFIDGCTKDFGRSDDELVDIVYSRGKYFVENPDGDGDVDLGKKALKAVKDFVKYIDEARKTREDVLKGK